MATVTETEILYERYCRSKNLPINGLVKSVLEFMMTDENQRVRPSRNLKLCGDLELCQPRVRIADADLVPIILTLAESRAFDALDLRYNRITDAGCTDLVNLLKVCPHILWLNIMCNDIGENGALAIAKALHNNSTLLSLKINGNKIGDRGAMHFAQMLQLNISLEALDLGDCDLGLSSIIAIATVLRYNTSLKSITLNRPLVWTKQEEHIFHIAQMLKVNSTLTELHLQKSSLTDWGTERLAEALLENHTLKLLDISSNLVTRDGGRALAKSLEKNSHLEVLDLGNCRMEDEGAGYLARCIAMHNHGLKTLNVTYNNIKGPGLCALADSLKTNRTLESLFIWGNVLEESACLAFAHLLETGRLLEKGADVRGYTVDGHAYLAATGRQLDYRNYYYWAPRYGSDVPSKDEWKLYP